MAYAGIEVKFLAFHCRALLLYFGFLHKEAIDKTQQENQQNDCYCSQTGKKLLRVDLVDVIVGFVAQSLNLLGLVYYLVGFHLNNACIIDSDHGCHERCFFVIVFTFQDIESQL